MDNPSLKAMTRGSQERRGDRSGAFPTYFVSAHSNYDSNVDMQREKGLLV